MTHITIFSDGYWFLRSHSSHSLESLSLQNYGRMSQPISGAWVYPTIVQVIARLASHKTSTCACAFSLAKTN
jgi:hypothetical protein